jgi:antibiotic biosynthesis monooxygenase (ABM) superfamily enzyme
MALVTWAGAWTTITLILWLLGPLMDTWPLPLRTPMLSALMVLALTWVAIPALTRMLAGWLASAPRTHFRPVHASAATVHRVIATRKEHES